MEDVISQTLSVNVNRLHPQISVSTLCPYCMYGSDRTEQPADRWNPDHGSADQLFTLIQSGWVSAGLRSSDGLQIFSAHGSHVSK
jgi:hypothetical protein